LFTSAFNEKRCFDIYAFFGSRLLVKTLQQTLRMAKVVLVIELVRHIENRIDVSCSRKMKQPHVLNLYKMTEGHESNERKTKRRKDLGRFAFLQKTLPT
jgi:hypothetical protein